MCKKKKGKEKEKVEGIASVRGCILGCVILGCDTEQL